MVGSHVILRVWILYGISSSLRVASTRKFWDASLKLYHRRTPRESKSIGSQLTVLELANLSGHIPNPCSNGGILLRNRARNKYVCQCPEGYDGTHCEIRTRVCLEIGDACTFHDNSSVAYECHAVQGGGFACYYYPPPYRKFWCSKEGDPTICPRGWICLDHVVGRNQGYRCLPPGQISPPRSRSKREVDSVDECDCRNGARCNKYGTCDCLPHFTGPYCESQINYCSSNPCPPNIDCQPIPGSYYCDCSGTRAGQDCSETRRIASNKRMISPNFHYHANQYASVPATYMFVAKEVGSLPKLEINFGDGTVVLATQTDFHVSEDLDKILISFLFQPSIDKGKLYFFNVTHSYETPGFYNISLTTWNGHVVSLKSRVTLRVSSPEDCQFTVELSNAATTTDTFIQYNRRHRIDFYSLSTVTCPGTRLKFVWELFAVPTLFVDHTRAKQRINLATASTNSDYHVAPYTLAFGNYVLRLLVEMMEPVRGRYKTLVTWFQIAKENILVHIHGGTVRYISPARSLRIDASDSFDPNFPSTSMTFEWTCVAPKPTDVVQGLCETIPRSISNESVLKVEGGFLKANGVYLFSVHITSVENDNAEQSVRVEVGGEITEFVQILCVQNCLGNKVVTSMPMALRASAINVRDTANYTWSISYGSEETWSDLEIEYYSDADYFGTKSNALLPDKVYVISVSIRNENDTDNRIGSADIELATYSSMINGFCTVSPPQGYALLTRFRIECFRFATNYLPIVYEIFQYRLPKEEPIMVDFGVSPEFGNITLAAGFPENDYSVILRTYASDGKGNVGFYEQDLTVFPISISTDLIDELAIIKKIITGTASSIGIHLANQQIRFAMRNILAASCSVYNVLSYHLTDELYPRKLGNLPWNAAALREQLETISQLKDIMMEYLARCELRSPIVAKYCGSTLTTILECDFNEILPREMIVPHANHRAVNVLENIVEMLHNMTQESGDVTLIRNHVLDIGTNFLTSASLLLKKPKGQTLEKLARRRWFKTRDLKTKDDPLDLVQRATDLATQTKSVTDHLDNYAALFARYIAPHDSNSVTDSLEEICISVQKTSPGLKTVTLPDYVEADVSIRNEEDRRAMYELRVLSFKNNPYWWKAHVEDMHFPLIHVNIFNVSRETENRTVSIGASARRRYSMATQSTGHSADLKFFSPKISELLQRRRIEGLVVFYPKRNYSTADIAIHKLEFRSGGKMILAFDDQQDHVSLRVVIKRGRRPRLEDFRQAQVIPRKNPRDFEKRSIHLESKNDGHSSVFYFVGILPHRIGSPSNKTNRWMGDRFGREKYSVARRKFGRSSFITYSFRAYNAQCLRWNVSQSQWNQHCKVMDSDLTDETITCHCDGFSTIGGSFRAAKAHPNFSVKAFPFGSGEDNSLIFWFFICVAVCFLGFFVWGAFRDRRDKQHGKLMKMEENKPSDAYSYIVSLHTRKNRKTSTTSRVSLMMEGSSGRSSTYILQSPKKQVMTTGAMDYFLLRTAESLGDVFCLHLSHDDEGKKALWFIGTVVVHDLQTHLVSTFVFDAWLPPRRPENDRAGLSCFRMLESERFPWKNRIRHVIDDKLNIGHHCWSGMFARQPPKYSTRRRRVVVGFTHVCLIMASIAGFYPMDGTPESQEPFSFAWEDVGVGFFGAVVGFILNCFLFWIAKNIAPSQSYAVSHSSKYVHEIVALMPASLVAAAPAISDYGETSGSKKLELDAMYKPGRNQLAGKKAVALSLNENQTGSVFYKQVISRTRPIAGKQSIRLAFRFSHVLLYPFWILLGAVILLAWYIVLSISSSYTWVTGWHYLLAALFGFLFSFVLLEPLKVLCLVVWDDRRHRDVFVVTYANEQWDDVDDGSGNQKP